MFSLSEPCELLFLLCFIASWTCVVTSVIVVCVFLPNVSVSVVCFVYECSLLNVCYLCG